MTILSSCRAWLRDVSNMFRILRLEIRVSKRSYKTGQVVNLSGVSKLQVKFRRENPLLGCSLLPEKSKAISERIRRGTRKRMNSDCEAEALYQESNFPFDLDQCRNMSILLDQHEIDSRYLVQEDGSKKGRRILAFKVTPSVRDRKCSQS